MRVGNNCWPFFHPQSLRDSPGGALGTVFPKPLASLRTACAFYSPPVASRQPRWGIGDRIPQTPCVASHCVRFLFTPSRFATAPVGHWGPYSPNPLRRFALRALFIHPQSLRDSPGGALGTVFPKPLASLRSEVTCFLWSVIYVFMTLCVAVCGVNIFFRGKGWLFCFLCFNL